MGTIHRLTKKALAALPETDCKTCLRVRSSIEGFVLAAETALSRSLGLAVGDGVSAEQSVGYMTCMEVEVPTVAETKAFMEKLGMSTAEFATAYGLPEENVIAHLERGTNLFEGWKQGDKLPELKAA